MIVTKQDIDGLSEAYSKLRDFMFDYEEFMSWLSNNPHVLMATEFSDYVPIYPGSPYSTPWIDNAYKRNEIEVYERPLFRDHRGQWLLLSVPTGSGSPDKLCSFSAPHPWGCGL